MKSQKMTLPKTVSRKWYQIDASKKPLGRVATDIANILRGKHKRQFTPNMDMGDFVVAINTSNLKFTGRKIKQKKYYHHSGYLGGLHTSTLEVELNKNPDQVLRRAVFNMLDNLKFRKKLISRLKFSKSATHQFKIDKEL